MEKILELAQKKCQQAEVFQIKNFMKSVLFENSTLQNLETNILSGIGLRLIKDGKIGFAYTRNLLNPAQLIENALLSLKGGVKAEFDFPLTPGIARHSPDLEAIQNFSSQELVCENERVHDYLGARIEHEIDTSAAVSSSQVRIINSKGTDLSYSGTEYHIDCAVNFPGTATGINRHYSAKEFAAMPDSILDEVIDLTRLSKKLIQPKSGRANVLFLPNSMFSLIWRIQSGINAKSVYEQTSPIAGQTGHLVMSDQLTIIDDPLNPDLVTARPFDDEGVQGKPLTLIENGILKNFYNDLHYASKLNQAPTGHGYKIIRWSDDTIALRPTPALTNMMIKPGNQSFKQLVQAMGRGIIIENVLGAHSGNIPNGDYSLGIAFGYAVENGEIIGRIKDAMVAGNIYQSLKNVIGLGNQCTHVGKAWGSTPALLIADENTTANG